MNLRLEQLAKWVSLIALIVLIGAPAFNINTIGEKQMADSWKTAPQLVWQNPNASYAGPYDGGGYGAANLIGSGATGAPYSMDNINAGKEILGGGVYNQTSGGGSNPAPAPDPYAQWGGRAAYDNMRSGFANQKNSILNSANAAAQQRGIEYKQGILDWGLGAKESQQAIDNRGINAEMAKSQGIKGVLGMVSRGIRSAGVMLANKNAGDSSAAGALAAAYGDIGKRQASGVNNAYGLEQNQITLDQQNLGARNALAMQKFEDSKQTVVNSIVSEAENNLAALDAQIAGASLPDRIAIEQEKQNIRNNAMSQLTQYDAELAKQRAAANPTSIDARREKAAELSRMGTASNMDFGYTTDVPAQFQNTGPFSSELPIFTYGRNKRTA